MIVSCPSCGTNYKRPVAPGPARARCGCCAKPIELSGLRPYRIVRADLAKVESRLPIGLDEPALASRIAARVSDAPAAPLVPLVSTPEKWDESDPLPEIPEMATAAQDFARGAEAQDSEEAERAIAESAPERSSSLVVFGFWAAGGAIIGTGTSWTLGGTTLAGAVAGGLLGLAAAWGFLRWTSRP